MGIDIDLKNLNIIATVFAIINCIESNNFNLIMIKNIKSSLYSPLINYYSSKGSVEFIKSISIMDLFDNVKRCTIQLILKQKDKHTEIEEYFDFDCPQYSFPELVMIYN